MPQISDSHCVCTFVQVVHTEFMKVVRTEYSAFKNLIKMSEKKGAAAIIIGLISKKASQGKRDRKVWVKAWIKRRKNLGV